MDWKEVIGKLAPTVATALAGPLGGAAVAALGSALGLDQPTEDKIAQVITSGQMTADQLAEIRKLELQYQDNEKERGFKYAELAFKDVDSARNREVQVKDNTNKVLAYTVVGAFIAMVGGTLLGYAHVDSVLAGTLVGYLSAKAEQVMTYYFGSSKGSADKNTMLFNSTPAGKQ